MVTIVIVHYRVGKELLACLESLFASRPKVPFEVIIVDNDEKKNIEKELKKKFPKVVHIVNENKGFGDACNVGARHAKGEYLFFLNPDTTVFPGAIDALVSFLQKKRNAGVVAPLLLGTDGVAYQQGTRTLNPLRAIFSLSFFHKLFPNNPIARKYLFSDWDRKSLKEVDVVPGTAFVMRRKLFEEIGGFDENFFLYFEEFDLCKRVKELGYKLFITPTAKVTHAWGLSTKQRADINTIFEKSRFYYFRKNFGIFSAVLTECVLRFSKYTALLLLVLLVGLFLRLHNIYEAMPFIGDQGWFYLSARDMVLTGHIPLVGIASSHPWLHQGALWTYLLAGGFSTLGFNPLVGAYITIFLGLLGILGMYKLGSVLFSKRVGIIAAALMGTSPLVIASDRMPYHTSPIPLFTIIFIYCLYKWVNGNVRFFPLVIFCLGVLYNFELATALLGIVTIGIWLYGCMVKKEWAKKVLSIKYFVLSMVAFIIPMVPMLLYDVGHGFPQTVGFVAWLGYKGLVMVGYPPLSHSVVTPWGDVVTFFVEQMRMVLFGYSWVVAVGIFLGSLGYLFSFWRKHTGSRTPRGIFEIKSGMTLLVVLNVLLVLGFFAARTPSGAYLPMMVPGMVLLIAAAIGHQVIKSSSHQVKNDIFLHLTSYILYLILVVVICLNAYYSFSMSKRDDSFARRVAAAKYIVKEAGGKEYNLKGRGEGSQFASFTMNYAYLTWWMGKGPARGKKELKFIIEETQGGIKVGKELIH